MSAKRRSKASGRSKKKSKPPASPKRAAAVRLLPFLAAAVLLSSVVGAAYSTAVHPGVVHDDKFFFPYDREFTSDDLKRFFVEDTWAGTGTSSGVYRPLLMYTIAMDSHFYGADAEGYHWTNVLLHILFTLILFVFIFFILRDNAKEEGARPTRCAGWRPHRSSSPKQEIVPQARYRSTDGAAAAYAARVR